MKNSLYALVPVLLVATLALSGCPRQPEEPVVEEPEQVVDLTGLKVAVLIAEGFHDGETLLPMEFLKERGAEVRVLGPEVGEVKAYNSEQLVAIEKAVAEADVEYYHALILPGGRGPAVLREHEGAVEFVRAFVESGKPVAAICHGPQVLITAGVVEGRTMTCFPGMAEELQAAGAIYVDQEVVMDGNLITSRVPDDIPVFNEAILASLRR